jgi:hypothetical protein
LSKRYFVGEKEVDWLRFGVRETRFGDFDPAWLGWAVGRVLRREKWFESSTVQVQEKLVQLAEVCPGLVGLIRFVRKTRLEQEIICVSGVECVDAGVRVALKLVRREEDVTFLLEERLIFPLVG